MLAETDYLVIRYDPSLGGVVRAILSKYANLIAGKGQWQEREKVCTVVTPAWPDTDDKEERTKFRCLFDDLIKELEAHGTHGISTEMRKKEVA